jgi:hypothetical protein
MNDPHVDVYKQLNKPPRRSWQTWALGLGLGAAETIVPAAGSPGNTLKEMGRGALSTLLNFPMGSAKQGFDLGQKAATGDPKAIGASLAILGSAASTLGGIAPPVEAPRAALPRSSTPGASAAARILGLDEPLLAERPAYERRGTGRPVSYKGMDTDFQLLGEPTQHVELDPEGLEELLNRAMWGQKKGPWRHPETLTPPAIEGISRFDMDTPFGFKGPENPLQVPKAELIERHVNSVMREQIMKNSGPMASTDITRIQDLLHFIEKAKKKGYDQ